MKSVLSPKPWRKSLISWIGMSVVLCLILFSGNPVSAQTTTGSIYGTVSDPSGAVIPNAVVTVRNVQTGITHTAQSNGSGNYVFPALDPGDYTVSTQVKGFQAQTQTGIRLDANQNVHVSFTLQTGSQSQTVTVSAATTLVDTRESQLGNTVDQKRIEDLPLNGRNAYDLVQLVPGVTHYSAAATIGDQNGTQFSDNGIRSNYDTFYLDGGFDTEIFRNGGNLIPNPDALQEFRILTGNFDAEFGRDPGGVVNMITRSGTNQYHGLAYDYLRNNVLNAKNYFNNEVTPLKQNQFGGNFGGPIKRNQAFFFLSYEGLRIITTQIVPSTLITLTPAEAKGDLSAPTVNPTPVLPAGTNCGTAKAPVICPAALDPVAQNLIKFVPLEDPTTGRPPEQFASANTTSNQGLARVDYQLTSRHELSGMFFTSHGTSVNPTQGFNKILDFSGATNYENQTNAVASDQWIISPNALNSLHFFYTLNHHIVGNRFNYDWHSLGSNVAEGALVSDQPQFGINGYWTMGLGGNGLLNQSQQVFGGFDTFNWTHGNHTVKFGGSFIWNKYAETSVFLGSGLLTFTGSTTKNALADFLLGKANTFVQNSGAFHRLHQPDPSLFIQDNWKATQRLTLNLGLRWEVFPPLSGQNNLGTFEANVQSKRFPTAPLGLLSTGDPGVPDGVLHTSWTKFAPRVGFAYDVFGDGKTALRGAYGIFYAASQETFTGNLEQQPFVLSVTTSKTPNLVNPYAPGPDPFPYVVDLQNPRYTSGSTIASLPPNESSVPYVQEFNLALQQQLSTNWSMQIAYVGNISRKFYLLRDQNSPVYVPGASISTAGLNARRPYQPTPTTYTFGEITEYDPASNGNYNSLQATLTRVFAHRFSLLASYVWSKTMDDVSVDPASATIPQLVNENNVGYDYGLSDQDVPQRFVASYLWAAPDVRRWSWIGKEVLSGWQINGITTLQSGSPFNVTSGKDTNLDGVNNDRPNQVGIPALSGSRSRGAKIQEFFNTSAFVQLPPDTPYGDVKRNSLIGPGYVNTDLSAFKDFALPKESTLQFRGEIYNLFNNVNLLNPISIMTSPKFGQITGANVPRIVQFALRYSF